uniref:non-specific serine/threonine protein kinase n=1 Tax=Oryza brachyantha TaxID=4533 RepID=J3MCZ8_ORYBR
MHLKPNSIVSFLVLLQLFHVLVRSHEAAAAATGGGGDSEQFMYEGFAGARLDLDGMALVEPDGKLMLSNVTSQLKGHAFHPAPLRFHALSARAPRNGTASAARSFSTTFVFAIAAEYVTVSGNGLAFFVAPSKNMSAALPSQFLGLFNSGNIGNASNHIFAVELDTIINPEFHDINSNHVGVDVNGLVSVDSKPAGYYADDTGEFKNLTLFSGAAMQVWVDYDGGAMGINVTLAPAEVPKPRQPLLSVPVALSSVVTDEAYVGFSSSTGPHKTRHYVLGWSFALDGPAPPLDYTKLPKLPRANAKRRSMLLKVVVPVATSLIVLAVVIGASLHIWHRRRRHAEVREDWEVEFGPHRFAYKDLVRATRGFDGKRLLGVGGFGRVYRGVLPASGTEVAVKIVSHDAKQGMRQFIAEVVSIGRLRHRNVVPLLGYCRRRGELLLVYDYMPNGSLDRWLLYDRGADPKTTRVVGTMGYLAPELAHTRRATPATDVFAFGSFVLEVVCGRRPIEHGGTGDGGDDGQLVLADWVLDRWHKGDIAGAADARLCGDYDREKAALVLKLGLLCSQPAPGARPSMRQVVQFLDGDAALPPELAPTYRSFTTLAITPSADGFDSSAVSCPSSTVTSVDGGGSSVHSGDRAQETETRSLIETL